MIAWDPIAPGENLLSSINWTPRLALGDSISTSVWSATTPAGLTVTPAPTVGNFTNVFISGVVAGNLGKLFTITNTITTATGQTEVETAQFVCALK
jgi:hypothetical protein